jgi:type II secretory pathway pseudopilin PulG
MGNSLRRPLGDRGFTYLLVLLIVAIVSAVAALSLQRGTALAQREKELELLYLGAQFRAALLTYQAATPPAAAPQPLSLEELVRDERGPIVRRHLRRIFVDPMTGNSTWGTVRDIRGGIIGVYSLAPGVPIKQKGFELEFATFEKAASYSDWVFGLSTAVPRPNGRGSLN